MDSFSFSPGQLQEAARRLRLLASETDVTVEPNSTDHRHLDRLGSAAQSAHRAVDATAAALERTAQQYLEVETEAERLIRTALGTAQ